MLEISSLECFRMKEEKWILEYCTHGDHQCFIYSTATCKNHCGRICYFLFSVFLKNIILFFILLAVNFNISSILGHLSNSLASFLFHSAALSLTLS